MKKVIDGKTYRLRRGQWVEVPPEWVGKTVSQQTINKRPSKQLHKHRKLQKYGDYNNRRRREQDKESLRSVKINYRACPSCQIGGLERVENADDGRPQFGCTRCLVRFTNGKDGGEYAKVLLPKKDES